MFHEDITTPDELPVNAVRLGPKVAYSWLNDQGPTQVKELKDLWVWHWCDHSLWEWSPGVLEDYYGGRKEWWSPTGVNSHDFISADPLHIEPSLLFVGCCNMHGWIRDGAWTDA